VALELGITRALQLPGTRALLEGKRLGLLCHEASVDEGTRPSLDSLRAAAPGLGARMAALYSPQHGLHGQDQDNMIETPHGRFGDIPLHSLYSETRKPTPAMLDDVDLVLVDLQDVGTRIYTYLYTTSYMMEAAAEAGKPVVVLDRPNPIGGASVQGTTLDPAYRSFVGLYPMPTRHGLTIGEAARFMNERHQLNVGRRCELHVVPMRGWRRDDYWSDTGLVFVMPSPNIPSAFTCHTFPGFVYFEGTNVSEARGTTRPLEQCGAPFVEAERVIAFLDAEYPSWRDGARVRPTGFQPTFQKHAARTCRGVIVHPVDRAAFNPVRTGLSLLRGIATLYELEFRWKQPPYEYEHERLPIDVIAGGTWVREWAEGKRPWSEYDERERADVAAFEQERREFLLY
jgi:uncharacterized protein YbbC (DUF1343 family)